jgi:CheY-like chemotaxis protein
MTLEYMDVVLAERYEIHAARSGPEAWDVLRVTPIDIVLMDISLAGKQTGIELTQEIRRSPEHRSLPIIAVTAHAYERDRDNCLIAGCDDFIRKPISGSLLLERMEQLLRR